ncbi:hypothetical protein [Niastella sp. OAS944]|nr:hypothetical protein [Chitinophagaceae bacterium OAS944]
MTRKQLPVLLLGLVKLPGSTSFSPMKYALVLQAYKIANVEYVCPGFSKN